MTHTLDLASLRWPASRAGEALEELARRSGLAVAAPELQAVPETLDLTDPQELGRWVDWAARRLGVGRGWRRSRRIGWALRPAAALPSAGSG